MHTQEQIKKIFSKRLRQVRTTKGYTQPQLAKLIDSTDRNISNYETGYSLPSVLVLFKISNALSTSIDFLLGLTDKPTITEKDDVLTTTDYEIIEQLKSEKEVYEYLAKNTESGVSYIYDSFKFMSKWRDIGRDD